MKLTLPSLLLAALFFVNNSSKAQIVYTNITDYTVNHSNPSFNLDIDQNGTADFEIIHDDVFGMVAFFKLKDGPNTLDNSGLKDISGADAMNLSAGYLIDVNSSTWYPTTSGGTGTGLFITQYQDFGNNLEALGQWVGGATNSYIAISFDIAGSTHYGWIRVDITGGVPVELTVKDFAYNLTPNQQIIAGDTVSVATSFNENKGVKQNISIYPNPSSGLFVVSFDEQIDDVNTISIYNNLGQQIQPSVTVTNGTEIKLATAYQGYCIVRVESSKSVEHIRLLVK